ncbi:MAG: hypothetical protein PSW75_03615 [bacterium]|nr:hypothetical protein [bacterium]MDI1336803.1 hypothetical protein [Lacunisphaera sp.]
MKKILLSLLAFGALLAAASAEKINLGGGKAAVLTLPSAWKSADLGPDTPAVGRSVRYVTRNDSNDEVLITLLPAQDEHMGDVENLRAMAEIATAQFVSGSVEGKADCKETRFGGAPGLTVTFTDADLVGKPSTKGDYKAVTCCFFYLGGNIMVTATIFTDDAKGPAHAEALHLVKSLSLTQAKDKI